MNLDKDRCVAGLGDKPVTLSRGLPRLDKGCHEIAQIDDSRRFRRHLIINPAGARNIGDEPVQP